MIISVSRRFVFCHIHKTAGESVTVALLPHLAWNDVVLGGTPAAERASEDYRARFGVFKHSAAHEIRTLIGPEAWSDYFTFCIVRHPVARAQSLYGYIRGKAESAGWRRWLPQPWRSSRWPAADWLAMRAYLETSDFSGFIRHPAFAEDEGAQPQAESVCDPETGALMVDFVGRLERLDEDFAKACRRIGLEGVTLGRKNVSTKGGGKTEMAPADREFLLERYARDLETFGYDA